LFLEEKRFLLEVLSSSKKKSTKDLLKKLHEIDLANGPLDKVLAYYFKKLQSDYYERFALWRMTYFNGGNLQDLQADSASKLKDPIIESIFKGTDIVEDEQTVQKSHERRLEKRRIEMAEIASQKTKQSAYKSARQQQ
jgi:hypothetical protein